MLMTPQSRDIPQLEAERHMAASSFIFGLAHFLTEEM